MKKNDTFYDWCISNNHNDFLELWDYELNNIIPQDITTGSGRKIFFKCPLNKHESYAVSIAKIVQKNKIPECKKCNSFEQWCIDNNRLDVLNRWDYELNDALPIDVQHGTLKKYYLKCPRGIHKSELKCLNNFTNKYKSQEGSIQCNVCNSFAQWGIDNICNDFLERYWDYEINTVNPWETFRSTKQFVYIKCQEKDYHKSYKITTNEFVNGRRCPYCAGKKVNYYDSLGYLYPEVLEIWSDKNKKSPYEYTPRAYQFVWFKCLDGIHEDYERNLDVAFKYEFRCPSCSREKSESILQEKVRLYLENNYKYKLLHEEKCSIVPINPKTNHNLPFDNEIVDLRLIVEVHGIQHYKHTNLHNLSANKFNTTPQYELHKIQLYDRYKRLIANHRNYYYLEIPYWTDDEDETYKKLISNKIELINKALSENLESVS